MANISKPLILPKEKFNSVMSIATSLVQDEVYIPCGGVMRSQISNAPDADIAIISIKGTKPEIINIVHKEYDENRTLAVMCCQQNVPVTFNGTYVWDISQKFTGHLTAMLKLGQNFQSEQEIILPEDLSDGVVFGSVFYDKYNHEIYFTGSHGSRVILFIVDENSLSLKKNIDLNPGIDMFQLITVSSSKNIYVPDGDVVMCISNVDEEISQLNIPENLPPSEGVLVEVCGICVDNRKNKLLVNCFYETELDERRHAVAEFSTEDNSFIRMSNIEINTSFPVEYAFFNEGNQVLITISINIISVFSVIDYSLVNSFNIGDDVDIESSNYIEITDTLVIAYTTGNEVIEVITIKNISDR